MKLNKKAEFDFTTYLIGLLLVMGIILSLSSFAGEVSNNYLPYGGNAVDNAKFKATYDKIDQISVITTQAQNATQNVDFGSAASTAIQYGSVLTVFKTIWNSITLPITMTGNVISDLGIPSPYNVILPSILVVLFFSTIIYLIFGRK